VKVLVSDIWHERNFLPSAV